VTPEFFSYVRTIVSQLLDEIEPSDRLQVAREWPLEYLLNE
jgi:hypothetical protein